MNHAAAAGRMDVDPTCNDGSRLQDLDFTDNIAWLSNSWNYMAQLTKNTHTWAKKLCLSINAAKTKLMKVWLWNEDGVVKTKEQEMEQVSAFCYLGCYLSDHISCHKENKVRIWYRNCSIRKG